MLVLTTLWKFHCSVLEVRHSEIHCIAQCCETPMWNWMICCGWLYLLIFTAPSVFLTLLKASFFFCFSRDIHWDFQSTLITVIHQPKTILPENLQTCFNLNANALVELSCGSSPLQKWNVHHFPGITLPDWNFCDLSKRRNMSILSVILYFIMANILNTEVCKLRKIVFIHRR